MSELDSVWHREKEEEKREQDSSEESARAEECVSERQ